MTLRLSSDKTPVGGAPPPGHAPDPSPPSLTHQSFGEATGSAMPSHGTAIPSLAQLSLNKMMEAISKAKTRKDIAKLSAIIGGSWKPQKHLRTLRPDTQILDPIGLSPTVSFLACACSIGTPELIKYLVEEHKGKLNFECLQRAIMFNRDPAVANYVSSVIGPDTINFEAGSTLGFTLLQAACMALNVGAVERLLKLGADVNKAPVNALPPLVIVVLNVLKPAGNPDEHKMRMIAGSMIFDMLALKGAYVNGFIIEPERPETPITLLDIAIREKDPFAEAMLRDHGAKTGDDLRRLNREIVQSKGSHKRKQ